MYSSDENMVRRYVCTRSKPRPVLCVLCYQVYQVDSKLRSVFQKTEDAVDGGDGIQRVTVVDSMIMAVGVRTNLGAQRGVHGNQPT